VAVHGDELHVRWSGAFPIKINTCIFDVKSLNPGNVDNDDVMDICEDVMES
jgi:hypothetical protein